MSFVLPCREVFFFYYFLLLWIKCSKIHTHLHQLHKQIHKANYEEGSVINPRFELRTYKYSESIQHTPREKCLYLEFFWSLFSPAFGLNKGRYFVSLRIQSGWGKIRTRKTRNTDSFHALIVDKENALLASLTSFLIHSNPKLVLLA